MAYSTNHRGRTSPLAPAAFLLLALCLLAGGAQGADVPRFVVGDVLDVASGNLTDRLVVAHVDTTSLPTPYYTTFPVEQNAGRWEIPRYWHWDLKYSEEQLVENLQASRAAHVDPVLVIITDETITGGDTLYAGLSLAEALGGATYWVEPPPGEPLGYPNAYIVGDILGNVSEPNRGSVVYRISEDDGTTQYWVYFDVARSGDRWILPDLYLYDSFTPSHLDLNGMRRVAHADPHTVIINDSTTNTGEMGWYRLSLAESFAGKIYDHMGNWYFNTGDIVGNETSATRYIVGNATTSDTGPSHYTLYEVVSGADGWEIPAWVNAGVPLEVPLGSQQFEDIPYDLVDHTDPHFAIVTDASVANGLTYAGLSLGEILEGTPGYPVDMPPVGGDRGYFLVSTVPAGADVYLVDISGARYLQGNTCSGPLNVTIMLTATPMKQIVANLSGYREATYAITQYPAKGQTVPVGLTLQPAGDGRPYPSAHAVPGRVEAEDYDVGGFSDTTPGNTGGVYRQDDVDIERTAGLGTPNVGWIRDGESLTYTVNVTRDGSYLVSLRVATPTSGRSVDVVVDGGRPITYRLPVTGSFATYATATLGSTPCPNSWVTATMTPAPMATGIENQPIPVHLSPGTHTVRLTFHGDGQNLDWFEIAPYGTVPPPSGNQPYPAPHAVPGRVESEDFDTEGYSDTTPTNEGGAYRPAEAVDIESGGSNYNVGWVRPGEYLEYSVDASSANNYLIGFRVANPGPAKTVTVRVNGAAKTLAIPSTGSFGTWQTATVFAGWLPAGRSTVRVESGAAGSFNLDYMQFTVGETPPPTTVITTPTTPVSSGGASFVAAPLSAPKGSAVKFTVTPASGKAIRSAWWSFDAPAHLNTWNSRVVNPTFYYPAKGTFSPLVKLTYADGSTETVQRTGYIRAT